MNSQGFDEYLRNLNARWRENKGQSLQLQVKLLAALRSRHLIWSNAKEDPERARIHLEIANSIKNILSQYDQLLMK